MYPSGKSEGIVLYEGDRKENKVKDWKVKGWRRKRAETYWWVKGGKTNIGSRTGRKNEVEYILRKKEKKSERDWKQQKE